jgi:hypothetical protein
MLNSTQFASSDQTYFVSTTLIGPRHLVSAGIVADRSVFGVGCGMLDHRVPARHMVAL